MYIFPSRKRRSGSTLMSPAYDANGNRILHVVKREADQAEKADVETEKVIQVREREIGRINHSIFFMRMRSRCFSDNCC